MYMYSHGQLSRNCISVIVICGMSVSRHPLNLSCSCMQECKAEERQILTATVAYTQPWGLLQFNGYRTMHASNRAHCTSSTFLMSGNLSLIAACTPMPMGGGPSNFTLHTPCSTLKTCMGPQKGISICHNEV